MPLGLQSVSRLRAVNGSAAAPSISFAADPDTGLYSISANQIGVAAGSVISARIGSDFLQMASGNRIAWTSGLVSSGSADDLVLVRDAANTLAQRNGTAAQVWRVYNTYANSGTDYERGFARWAANIYEIGSEAGGTGTNRPLRLQAGGGSSTTGLHLSVAGDRWIINSSGHLLSQGNRFQPIQGADVPSANDLTLGADGNVFEITGTTQVNRIVNTNWQNGSEVTLLFTGSVTVAHNQAASGVNIPILLAGAANFGATAGDTLTLRLSEIGGTQAWREMARAVI